MHKFSYRDKRRQTLKRFLNYTSEVNCFQVFIPTYILEPQPEGAPEGTIAPTPENIQRLLCNVRANDIDMLMLINLQVWFGLRPEEAFIALTRLREWFIDDRLYYPVAEAKIGTLDDRDIRICPAAAAWLNCVPGFTDGSKADFRPMGLKKPMAQSQAQGRVNDHLREAGFNPGPRLPKSPLRKAKFSAMIACGIPRKLVMREAGHTNPDTLRLHYDARWSRAMGLAFHKIFPTDEPHGFTDWELYHSWEQSNPVPQS